MESCSTLKEELNECVYLEDSVCQLCDDGRDCKCDEFISFIDWLKDKGESDD